MADYLNIVFPNTRSDTQGDRLGFSVVVAAAVHALLIFGVGFQFYQASKPAPFLEVTLAQHHSRETPEDPDYLAQVDQQGSGDEAEKKDLSTDRIPEISDAVLRETVPLTPPEPPPAMLEAAKAVVQTQRQADTAAAVSDQDAPKADIARPTPESVTPLQEIASLRAKLDAQQQEYSRMPRVLRLTAASTRAAEQAAYLNYWIDWVEEIGNRNYPDEARRRGVYGELRLAVMLLPDGSVEKVEILRSSGERLLDQAAVQIVRMASPFTPFPPEMAEWDKLEIIRTWQFVPGHQLQTQAQ